MTYEHPNDNNLKNLHKAMQYDDAGKPSVRTIVEGFSFDGNVYVSDVEISNDTGNPIPVSSNGTANSATNPIYVSAANSSGTTAVSFDGTNTDAFGRLRVSNPVTLFDSSFRYGDNTDNWDTSKIGTGDATYDGNKKVMALSVSALNDEVIRETKRVYQYQPGKSLLVLNTFCMTAPAAGLRQRVGYFGARNGVFLETDGTTVSFVIRKDITGTISDTERASQGSWNGDNLNSAVVTATCPSGILLDLSKTQIFWMDIEWLGVGSVRCGFVIDGQFIICHTFHHANVSNITGPYMGTACLPVRYEIKATGAVTGTMNQICSSVISEGGYTPKSRIISQSMGITTKRLTTSGTYYPLISIRLNSSYADAIIRLCQLNGMIPSASSAPKNIHFKVLKNATLTNDAFAQHASLKVDTDTAATVVAGGTVIFEGYFNASRTIALGEIDNPAYQLSRNIAGTGDVITIAATGDSNGLDIAMELGWFDLS